MHRASRAPELAMDFESHTNRALPARLGHRHARQGLALREQAQVLREVANLPQPLLAGGILLVGSF